MALLPLTDAAGGRGGDERARIIVDPQLEGSVQLLAYIVMSECGIENVMKPGKDQCLMGVAAKSIGSLAACGLE